jgi:hypothetical protein
MFEPTLIAIWLTATVAFNIPLVYIGMMMPGAKTGKILIAGALWALASYGALEYLLSYPKPLQWELWQEKYEVLSWRIKDGRYVYVWLKPETGDVPRYYVIPWNRGKDNFGERLARKLPLEYAKAKEKGSKLMFEPSLRRDPHGGLTAKEPPRQPPKEVPKQ